MVGFIVHADGILQRHQIATGALEHLTVGFQRLAMFEGMEIRNDDFRLPHIAEHACRHGFAFPVIAVWPVGIEHSQTVLDGREVIIRQPRLNRLLVGERTASSTCHAMNMTFTVVLPVRAPFSSRSGTVRDATPRKANLGIGCS